MPAHTCHRNLVSTPEQQCCTPPSEAPGPRQTHTREKGHVSILLSDLVCILNVGHVQSYKNVLHADLGEVELKRIISGQRDHEASGQVLWQRVAMVTEEQAVVTQW